MLKVECDSVSTFPITVVLDDDTLELLARN